MIRALCLALLLVTAARADPPRMLSAAEAEKWTAIGRVNVAGYARKGMCSGTLIEPDLVLTAAHCVVNRRTGRMPRLGDVHFVAGWRKGKWRAHSTAAAIAIHPDYDPLKTVSARQIAADLALIRLRTRIDPDRVTPFGTGADIAATLRLISYRRDRAHALSGQDCPVVRRGRAVLHLACDVIFGASGAPLFAGPPETPRIVAVLSAKQRGKAYAVRLDHALAPVRAALAGR